VRVGVLRTFVCLSTNCMAPTCMPSRLIRWPGRRSALLTAASLAVAMIGHALAQARGLATKHAVKQVDRLLSNDSVNVWDSFAR
jgi:hypothetical protein